MKYVNQDITSVTSGIICHGVNCQGVMGSGVAKAIRNKWPDVYKAYKQQPTGGDMLGVCHTICVQDEPELIVANCYTQEYYGKDGRVYASIKAIEDSLSYAFFIASTFELTLHSPKIGCGLGGLRWYNKVDGVYEKLIKRFAHKDVVIYDWNP